MRIAIMNPLAKPLNWHFPKKRFQQYQQATRVDLVLSEVFAGAASMMATILYSTRRHCRRCMNAKARLHRND